MTTIGPSVATRVARRHPGRGCAAPTLAGVTDRRRDRHGRGARGPLAPATVPLRRSRAEQFDDLVLDAVEDLEQRWAAELRGVEFAVEDVPPDVAGDAEVPLARLMPRAGGDPARVVVYRRPLELRARDRDDLAGLVHDVVVEQVADLLEVDPETVDPGYGDEE